MPATDLISTTRRLWPSSHWQFTSFGLLAFLAVGWGWFYGQTLDVGFHYALASDLYQHRGPAGNSPEHLGVMYGYPAGAHWAAAALSRITQHPLLSMNLISDVAIFGAYLCIALLLHHSNLALNVLRLGVMLAAVWWLSTQQAAFGFQVIMNFFYPQLVGEAIVMGVLCAMTGDRFNGLWWPYQAGLLAALVWLLGYIQPLAAVELAACAFVLAALSGLLRLQTWREGKAAALLRLLVLGSALTATIVFQPALATMRALAANDGYLRFGSLLAAQHYAYLLGFGVAIAGLAIFGVIAGKLERRRGLLLGSCTFAATALLVAQWVLFVQFGFVSEYAVSKFVFFLTTMCAVTVAYASPMLIPGVKRELETQSRRGRAVVVLLPGLFALLASYLVFSQAFIWRQDLRPILQYQSSVEEYRQHSLPADGVGTTASLNANFTPIVNFLVSVGELGLPIDIGTLLAESGASLDVPVKYAIISDSRATRDAAEPCAIAVLTKPASIVLDRQCFLSSSRALPINRPMAAGREGEASRYLTFGWDRGEQWGSWSTGEVARIEFVVPPGTLSERFSLRVAYVAFIAPGRAQQKFAVVVDGVRHDEYAVTDSGRNEFVAPIESNGLHVIELHFDNPRSPADIGVSASDTRKIAIAVVEVELRTRAKN